MTNRDAFAFPAFEKMQNVAFAFLLYHVVYQALLPKAVSVYDDS